MASTTERQRNNLRMGIFVTICLALGMGVIVVLSDALSYFRAGTESYTVRFSVQAGISHLKPGSDVRVGGMKLGQVTAIVPQYTDGTSAPFRFIDVNFELDRRVQLYENARVLVSAPLIGADAWLDIPYVGEGSPVRDRLQGADEVGMLTALLGDEGAAQAKQMMVNAQEFTEFLASVQGEYERNVTPMMTNLNAAAADARAVMGTVRNEDWPRWSGSIDSMLLWASASTEDVDALLAEGRGALTDARTAIAENREDLRATTANMAAASEDWREASHRINTELVDQMQHLLATGQSGLEEAHAALQTFRTDYDGWAVDMGEAMSRANLAAQQLNLTMVEVRRSPWKVLYRPSEKELEHELLYEAARSFAVAAADLKAASLSVQRVLERHGDQSNVDEAARERITRNLLDPLEKYETAQQRLLDVIFAEQ